jgi:hypothetical protein
MLKADTPVFTYVAGTWGPAEAARIAPPDGGWKNPTGPDEETNSMMLTAE